MNKTFRFICGVIAVAAVLAAILVQAAAPLVSAARQSRRQPQRILSYWQLTQLLKAHQPRYFASYRTGLQALAGSAPVVALANSGAASDSGSGAPTFSTTTTQVAGVDEGDMVKNNGANIYQINQGRVLILQAYPDSELAVLNTLDYTAANFYPQELYLDAKYLTVIGTAFETPAAPAGTSARTAPIWYFSTSTVQAKIYDITDPANPVKIREVEVAGDYVSTRKIGSSLYLVARQYPDYYAQPLITKANGFTIQRTPSVRTLVPSYRDSKLGKLVHSLPLARCFFFPGFDDPVYLVVAGLDLANPRAVLDVSAFLGAGDQVYASLNNLYVTGSRPLDIFFAERINLTAASVVTGGVASAGAANLTAAALVIGLPTPGPTPVAALAEQTDIYKIALSNGHSQFIAGNTVTGSVLNAYSMDENNGYFRIATTQHAWWSADGHQHNHLLVFDANLQLSGRLDDFAPGESIYAARFLGDHAFLVTYQQIDPLFAIDLSSPTNPVIVGQLTLPGYSNFLLPYDANHLIGIGKDVTISQTDTNTTGDVPWWDGAAFYQGMKVALFDVTDLRNPTLVDSVSIGDRGTDSQALWDPHALLFDPAKNLLAFPITVAQLSNPDPTDPWQWGDAVFQGAYVFNVSATGFQLKGTITHVPAGQDIWSSWGSDITRVLDIGSDIYTLSDSTVKANDLDSLAEKAALVLPQPTNQTWPVIITVP